MVESVEGEKERVESEEAMDKKGALERLENFKDITLEKIKNSSLTPIYSFLWSNKEEDAHGL